MSFPPRSTESTRLPVTPRAVTPDEATRDVWERLAKRWNCRELAGARLVRDRLTPFSQATHRPSSPVVSGRAGGPTGTAGFYDP